MLRDLCRIQYSDPQLLGASLLLPFVFIALDYSDIPRHFFNQNGKRGSSSTEYKTQQLQRKFHHENNHILQVHHQDQIEGLLPRPIMPADESKKHREKKEERCRMLEDELHRLYELLTDSRELQDLYCENAILKDIISRHSIPFPAGIRSHGSPFARVTRLDEDRDTQSLQVQMPDNIDMTYGHSSQDPLLVAENSTNLHSPLQLEKVKDHAPTRPLQRCPSDYEFTQLGVDFVLSLERPCLFHTQPSNKQEPSGHAMSLQGILLSNAPPDFKTWEIPAQQLKKLFELSGYLALDGCITPVQAWNRICHRFDVGKLPDGCLDRLKSAMTPHIRCYGFGARIDERVFEGLLHSLLQ